MSVSTQIRKSSQFSVARHPAATRIGFGDFEYDLRDRRLQRHGEDVDLPPRALAVLDTLLARQGSVVSKEKLIEEVWNGAHVADASITEAVSLLRQALGDSPQTPRFIRTVHRRGYRFVAQVSPAGPTEPQAVELLHELPTVTSERKDPAPEIPHRGFAEVGSRWLIWSLGAIVAVQALLLWLGRSGDGPVSSKTDTRALVASSGAMESGARSRQPTRFLLPWVPGDEIHPKYPVLAMSADGRQLAWTVVRGENAMLVHQSLDRYEPTSIPVPRGAQAPFFSPDGRWIGFFAERRLWKIDPRDGSRVAVCETSKALGASWGSDSIVFSPHPGTTLLRVPAIGGEPEILAHADPSAGEVALIWPQHLPNGDLLVTAWSNTVGTASIIRLDPDTGTRRTVVAGAAGAKWLAPREPGMPGHLIFSRPDGTAAATYDPETGDLGPPVPVLPDLEPCPFTGLLHMALAPRGAMAYLPETDRSDPVRAAGRRLVRIDRTGRVTPLPTPPRFYRNLEVSPDGTQAAVTIAEEGESDVWIVDLEQGTLRRLTFEGFDIEPVWTPDGRSVTFASDRGGHYGIHRKSADGRGDADLLFERPHHSYPWAWMPDGEHLLYTEAHPETAWDLWLWKEGGERRPIFVSQALESAAAPSPDGDLLAAGISVNGDWQIFLFDFPSLSSRWQISSDGGWSPFWSVDGTRLYFHDAEGLQEVEIRRNGQVLPGSPTKVLDHDLGLEMIQPAKDGFLAIQDRRTKTPQGIRIVLDWSPPAP
ncbi:MAG: winged helix-turn-helix domain-containing protein [Thermoanaerobaculia bacterium]|nr:winged helix-turn-helix domain-containing protein [Thermoanaerobaculia bacterium]